MSQTAVVRSLGKFLSTQWGMAFIVLVVLLPDFPSYAQQLPPEVEQMGYADTIFINGKIVSMDDASISTEVGNIYEALAVKGNKIMKLGSSAEVRTMAGPHHPGSGPEGADPDPRHH